MKTIETESGPFVVYHVTEAGSPSAHNTTRGEWFFQPSDVNDGEAYSGGYPTEMAASDAARVWATSQADELTY